MDEQVQSATPDRAPQHQLDYASPQTNRDSNPHRRRFIQFLVVAAIIAILAGILLPGVNKRRRPSPSVQCMSNLRFLAMAMINYAVDNRGQLPDSLDTIVLSKYLGAPPPAHVLVCPSCKDKAASAATAQQLVRAINSKPRPEAYPLTAARPPGHVSYIYCGAGLKLRSRLLARTVLIYEPLTNGHASGANQSICIAFLDGHVDMVPRNLAAAILTEVQAGHNPPRPEMVNQAAASNPSQ